MFGIYNTREIEPLIVIVGALTAIITSALFKFGKNEEQNINTVSEKKSSLTIEKLNAKNDIKVKATQKKGYRGNTSIRNIKSKRGKINIDLDQE